MGEPYPGCLQDCLVNLSDPTSLPLTKLKDNLYILGPALVFFVSTIHSALIFLMSKLLGFELNIDQVLGLCFVSPKQ